MAVSPAAQNEPTTSAPSRALAPDLARGGMLLLIALANAPWFLWGRPHGPSSAHPADGNLVDVLVQAITIIAVDMRTYPMFAFLFGYGMVQFARSRSVRGFEDRPIRRMLRQRHWAMIGIGLVHAALLWFGDVIGTYGIIGLVLVWIFLRRRTRTLKVWIGIFAGLAILGVVLSLVGGWFVATSGQAASEGAAMSSSISVNGIESYPASVLPRILAWTQVTALGLSTTLLPVLISWVWARAGILDQPAAHLSLLRRTAVIGIAVGWLGAVPSLLVHLQVLPGSENYWWAFMSLQSVSGMACGIGYVSVFALVAHRIAQPSIDGRVRGVGPVARVLESVGQNSMTCYLGQSVVLAPVLAAWGFGIGGWLGSAGSAVLAVLTWVLWAVVAHLLTVRGKRGPAERLLRRLTNAGVSRPEHP